VGEIKIVKCREINIMKCGEIRKIMKINKCWGFKGYNLMNTQGKMEVAEMWRM
jgi:hypothetical protein